MGQSPPPTPLSPLLFFLPGVGLGRNCPSSLKPFSVGRWLGWGAGDAWCTTLCSPQADRGKKKKQQHQSRFFKKNHRAILPNLWLFVLQSHFTQSDRGPEWVGPICPVSGEGDPKHPVWSVLWPPFPAGRCNSRTSPIGGHLLASSAECRWAVQEFRKANNCILGGQGGTNWVAQSGVAATAGGGNPPPPSPGGPIRFGPKGRGGLSEKDLSPSLVVRPGCCAVCRGYF